MIIQMRLSLNNRFKENSNFKTGIHTEKKRKSSTKELYLTTLKIKGIEKY